MYDNLKAEMTRAGVTKYDLAKVTGKTFRAIQDKLNGVTDFTVPEAIAIQTTFFPTMKFEYLFTKEAL